MTRRHLLHAVLVALLVGGYWSVFARRGAFEGTEARRTMIAREMLRSGDWVVPRLAGQATLAKPPLHYQLQAAAMSVFGESRLAARLPALTLLAVFVAAAYLAGRSFGRSPGHAWAGVALLATHPLLLKFAASAEIDGPFAAWTALALLALARASTRGAGMGWVVLSGLASGLGFLSKGPPILLYLLPAFLPLCLGTPWRSIFGWLGKGLLCWLLPAALPLSVWLLLLGSRGFSLTEVLRISGEESIGRSGYFTWGDVLEIPLDFLRVLLMLCPLLLLVPAALSARRKGARENRALRVLLFAGAGGLLLYAFFPHRATRYLLPGILVLLFFLVHGTTAFLHEPPAWTNGMRGALQALSLLAIPLVLLLAPPWVGVAPLALCVVFIGASMRSLLPSFLALGIAAQWVLGLDIASRNELPPRNVELIGVSIAREVGEAKLTCWGHVPAQVLWRLDEGVRMDEGFRSKSIQTPWLLYEDRPGMWRARTPVPCRERLRVSVQHYDLVLAKVEGQ